MLESTSTGWSICSLCMVLLDQITLVFVWSQAGSDSLLTSCTFIKLAKKFFAGVDGAWQHAGILYGLGADANSNAWHFQDHLD